MRKVRWVFQDNLISENDLNQVQSACTTLNIPYQTIRVIPFSSELPEITIDDSTNIYYGSTTLMYNIYHKMNKPMGLFFDEDTFLMENYLNKWGNNMLSSEANILTFKEFIDAKHPQDSEWFIRPNDDSKSFDGDVKKYGDVGDWFQRLKLLYENVNIGPDTKILVGPAYNIAKEWRNYIVDGKVVASSLYRKNFKLSKSRLDIPKEMITFVEERCKEYMPHKLFAMDIALCGGEYFIIECGCINSVGFYAADISEIIKNITNWVKNN